LIKILSSLLKNMFTNTAVHDVCNDVIPMLQILEVVLQHILGVVDNVIYCFVENSTYFSAVKEF